MHSMACTRSFCATSRRRCARSAASSAVASAAPSGSSTRARSSRSAYYSSSSRALLSSSSCSSSSFAGAAIPVSSLSSSSYSCPSSFARHFPLSSSSSPRRSLSTAAIQAKVDSDLSRKDSDDGGADDDDYSSSSSSSAFSSSSSSSSSPLGNDFLRADLRPSALVAELDRHIVGQHEAKRAVAVALRNRWRRHALTPDMRQEVTPRNILMTGPTGSGKTEIARRVAKITDSPFIRVEATKFTEVGFFGKDVESIIKDLARVTVPMMRARRRQKYAERVNGGVEEMLVDALIAAQVHQRTPSSPSSSSSSAIPMPASADASASASSEPDHQATPPSSSQISSSSSSSSVSTETESSSCSSDPSPSCPSTSPEDAANSIRASLKARLRAHEFEEEMIEIEIPSSPASAESREMQRAQESVMSIFEGKGLRVFSSSRPASKKMPLKEARSLLLEAELSKVMSSEDLNVLAKRAIEEDGIVFLDEIDKICSASGDAQRRSHADASAEGVQRDLLPLIEGSSVSTSLGVIDTSHILFICSGAFHSVKPSDLLPELQGRLPIRVELKALSEHEMYQILTVPEFNLLMQQVELLKTDGVELVFEDEAVREIARLAVEVNRNVENIGARRLNTIIAQIVDEISYQAADLPPHTRIIIDKERVAEKVAHLVKSADLTRYLL